MIRKHPVQDNRSECQLIRAFRSAHTSANTKRGDPGPRTRTYRVTGSYAPHMLAQPAT